MHGTISMKATGEKHHLNYSQVPIELSAPSILIILLDFYFFDVDCFANFIEFVTLLLLLYVLSF